MLKNIKIGVLFLAVLSCCLSCDKDPQNAIDGKGVSRVKITGADELEMLVGVKADPVAQKVQLVELQRLAISENDLSSTLVVKLTPTNERIDAHNFDTSSKFLYTPLPSASFTSDPLEVTFGPGEFTKVINITINPATLVLSNVYALEYELSVVAGSSSPSNGFDHALIRVIVKNDYDGEYKSTGTFVHPTNGPRDIDESKTLSTIDKFTCETKFADLGSAGWLMWLVVDPATNFVTLIPKGSANAGTITQPGKQNYYDPATKSYHLFYQYAGGGGNRVIDEVITKK